MNFEAAVEQVLTIVKRPDLLPRIQSAVSASILRCHHSDFFYRDIVEVPVQFTEVKHLQRFTPTEVLPRFRKVKYIRYWHGGTDGRFGAMFTPIQIEASVDGYGYERDDVFYMAGTKLQLRGSLPIHRILFGAYQHPVISPTDAVESWILAEYPFAVIYDAAATIFRGINFAEQAAAYTNLALEELYKVKISNVDDIPLT